MNGVKVLNQLIKLFLVINIILFLINYLYKGNQYVLSQERIRHITQLLEEKGISIEVDLPRKYNPQYSAHLIFLGDSVAVREKLVNNFFAQGLRDVRRSSKNSEKIANGKILYYTLDNEILGFDHDEVIYERTGITSTSKKTNLEQSKTICENFIKRLIGPNFNLDYYVEAKEKEDYWEITYYPTVEDIPLVDSYMTFQVDETGVKNVSMYLAEIEIKHDVKKKIYAADLVLFGIEDYMIDNGYNHIKDISLWYKRVENDENILGQEIIPVYKIQMDGLEETIFVNAYTNEILN